VGVTLSYFGAASLAGAKVAMLTQWDAERAFEFIKKEKPTILAAIPAQLAMMIGHLEFARQDFSSLRIANAGAASFPYELSMELEEKTGARLVTCYGSLDAGGYRYGNVDSPLEIRHRTVGKPASGNEIKLIDDNSNEVQVGDVGEVIARGSHFSSGYYHDEDATLKAEGKMDQ
jgi:non-ribosomal peptide synthetase component E (peptide arylation enzyme)